MIRGIVVLLVLVWCVDAQATQTTNLTGAAWPTSGAASTGTTGLSALTGTWTHVGSTDVPTGSAANGYIQMAESASGSFRIDATNVPFASSSDYWIRFWIYPKTSTTTLDADAATFYLNTITSGGTRIRTSVYLRNTTGTTSPSTTKGMTIFSNEFLTGGATSTLDQVGGSGGQTLIPLNVWSEIVVHMRVDATDGRYGIYVNGVLLTENRAIDTTPTGGIATVDAQGQWTMGLGPLTGVQFRVAGPIESWSGTDITVRPRYELEPSTSYRTKVFGHFDTTSIYSQGLFFSYGGTATQTLTSYATSGVNPGQRRSVVTGSSTQTATVTTIDALGTLPYNSQGWATVFFSDFYLPGTGTTCDFVIRNAGNTGDVVRLTYDGTDLKQGSTVLKAAMAKTSRLKLAIHLSSTGSATYSLIDETAATSSTQTYFSGVLTNWTPQVLGVAAYQGVYGDTAFELGSISVHSWLEMDAVDSFTAAAVTALAPAKQGPNHVSGIFTQDAAPNMIPNNWQLRDVWTAAGYGRRGIYAHTGRSGLSRASWTTNVLAGMTYAKGIALWFIDGGSINDVGSGNSAGNVTTVPASMSTNLESAISALTANGNQVILSTMMKREQGTYTANDNLIIAAFNSEVRRLFLKYRGTGLVYWTNPRVTVGADRMLQVAGDDVHASAFGDYVQARDMASTLTTLPMSTRSAGN